MNNTAEQRQAIDALCRRCRVRALRLIGAAGVGRERDNSDVDLIVEVVPGQAPSAFEVVDLQDALSRVFGGRPVDLAFAGILNNPFRRRAIEPQLRPLYAADAAG